MKLHLIDKELQYQQTQINELQHELNLRKLTPKAFPKHSSDFIPPNIQNTITHLQNENTDLKTKLSENEKIIQEFHTIMKDAYTKMEHLYKLNELLHAENTKLQTELTQLKAHHHNSNYQNVKCFGVKQKVGLWRKKVTISPRQYSSNSTVRVIPHLICIIIIESHSVVSLHSLQPHGLYSPWI